jgi:F-type H+-transporting ATPase subunit b
MWLLSAAAAAHEIPLIDLDYTVLIQFAFFLLLLIVLNQFLYRPYLRLEEARNQATEGRIREAERLESQALIKLEELEGRLAEAKAQGADERARIRAEAAASEQAIVEAARKEVTRRVAEAKAEVAKTGAQLRAELASEVDVLARRIASQVLGKDIH